MSPENGFFWAWWSSLLTLIVNTAVWFSFFCSALLFVSHCDFLIQLKPTHVYCSSRVQFDAFITSENNKGKRVNVHTFDIAPLRSESSPQKRSGRPNMALKIFGQDRPCAGPLHGNGDVIATKELARIDTQLLQHHEKFAKLTLKQSSLCHRRSDTR